MNILLLLIPISLLLIGVAIWAFAWAVRRGQFENLDAAALDVLVDEFPDPVACAGGRRSTPSSEPYPNPRAAPRPAQARAFGRTRARGAQDLRPQPEGNGASGKEPRP